MSRKQRPYSVIEVKEREQEVLARIADALTPEAIRVLERVTIRVYEERLHDFENCPHCDGTGWQEGAP